MSQHEPEVLTLEVTASQLTGALIQSRRLRLPNEKVTETLAKLASDLEESGDDSLILVFTRGDEQAASLSPAQAAELS